MSDLICPKCGEKMVRGGLWKLGTFYPDGKSRFIEGKPFCRNCTKKATMNTFLPEGNKMSRKQKAMTLVNCGECETMKEAYIFLEDMGE